MGADPFGPRVRERFPDLVPQGVSAELVADKWGLTREQLDEFSVESHRRAAAARDSGAFDDEIVPVGGLTRDETIRPDSTVGKLATLAPAFDTEQYRRQFPHLDFKVTAGSSSQLTDGAGALVLMSEERAAALGLRPRARILASAVVGDDPTLMLTGPIPATHKALARCALQIDQIDAIEVNEAFAPVPLAWLAEFPVDPARLNPRGGAIALGHPLGASGARLMTTMLHHLEQTGGRYGLQTMCEAGGMANATVVELM
jgi:acetyl-CoA acetyltransferase family protein